MRKPSNPHLSADEQFNNSFIISFTYNQYNNEHFGLGLSLDYVRTVVSMKISSGGLGGGYYTDTANYRFGFINVTLLPGFKWGNNIQFFVQAGPYFGFLTNTNQDARGNIQTIDAGLTLILGLRIHLARQIGIVIKNSYSYGFVNKYQDAGNLTTLKINVLAGVFYSFGSK